MSRRYTAHEMREIAERMSDYESGRFGLELYDLRTNCIESKATDDVASMLRQAADEKIRLDSILDAIEKEFKKQSTCRSCEWRGKSIRSEPACPCDKDENCSVYEIDVIDRLRQAADIMEHEKKYEFSVYPPEVNGVFQYRAGAELKAFMLKHAGIGEGTIIRRNVGEWEKVEE